VEIGAFGAKPKMMTGNMTQQSKIEFTFYGDLLGISNYYRLSSEVAYQKLNRYYNITFQCFSGYCDENIGNINVEMFSDSVLIWGNDLQSVLVLLQKLYINLIDESLLLRGAIVSEKLSQDPRKTVQNFRKFLPENKALANAVGLESTQKGARLLLENTLAEKMLREVPDWLTNEGYLKDLNQNIQEEDIRRKICPTPKNETYEILYFWEGEQLNHNNYEKRRTHFKELSQFVDEPILTHFRETTMLLERCELRQKITKEKLHN
jgi:hypothetical protein